MNKWFEKLPDLCPPSTAFSPEGHIFYRFCKKNPPVDDDFFSHRKLNPERNYVVSECQAMSVSLFETFEKMKEKQKLPHFRKKHIIKISLSADDGLVAKTGSDGHFSWWRSATCEIERCLGLQNEN